MPSKELKEYIENNIIPLYQSLDFAHRGNHVHDVTKRALAIAKDYDLDLNMMYVISAFHDVGLIYGRQDHHLQGAIMLENDTFIKTFFSKEEIKVMKEAVEDHRASNKHEPRSMYGKVICEADRGEPVDVIIARALLFADKDGMTFNELFPLVDKHIKEKYGEGGYIKVWLKTTYMQTMQEELWALLKDKETFKAYVQEIYANLDKYR